jgi:hypothetical protein
MNTEAEQRTTEKPTEPVHIFIDDIRYEFPTRRATGLELKQRAGARASDGLYTKIDGKLVEIPNGKILELHDGERFSIVPDGNVS